MANARQIEVGSGGRLALTYRGVSFIRNLDDGPEHSVDLFIASAGTIYDHGGRIMFVDLRYSAILLLTTLLPAYWLVLRLIRRPTFPVITKQP